MPLNFLCQDGHPGLPCALVSSYSLMFALALVSTGPALVFDSATLVLGCSAGSVLILACSAQVLSLSVCFNVVVFSSSSTAVVVSDSGRSAVVGNLRQPYREP